MRLLQRHCFKIFLVLSLVFMTCSCTSIDNDRSTNFTQPIYETQIDFTPYTQEQRDQVLLREKAFFRIRLAAFKSEMEEQQNERNKVYLSIKKEFPDCENQKHCMSDLARGSVARFEKYSSYLEVLRKYDAKLVVLEDRIQLLERTQKMRERAVYNRYLINEFLNLEPEKRQTVNIIVHSLEAFDLRRQTSHALFRFADVPDLLPIQAVDLDFRMFGAPIDEAAVIATFDIHVIEDPILKIKPVHFVASFLVNMRQVDSFQYQKQFRRYWLHKFREPDLLTLKNEVYCAFYSIASNSVIPRLQTTKISKCSDRRTFIQNSRDVSASGNSDYWMLPLAFNEIKIENVK